MSELFNYIDLLGTPFKMGGRDKTGLDCYGLVKELYSRVGITLPEYTSSHLSANDKTIISMMISQGLDLFSRIYTPEPFSLVTFFIRPPFTTHIGVVMPDKYRFIHILKDTSVAVERLDAPEWEKRITGYFKWKTN